LLSWNARHFNNKVLICEPPDEKKLPKNSGLVISAVCAATIRRFPPASLQHNRIPPFQSIEPIALTKEDPMPVSHDLYQDLHYPREIVQQRRQQDKALDRLLDEYMDIDNQVLAAESISAGNFVDEDLRHLKERRLAVKYMIERQLERKA